MSKIFTTLLAVCILSLSGAAFAASPKIMKKKEMMKEPMVNTMVDDKKKKPAMMDDKMEKPAMMDDKIKKMKKMENMKKMN